jgi:hypothetical protein
MFTSGRKHEKFYMRVFENVESISNLIHVGKQRNPTQNQEIEDGRPAFCQF